jgi:hypothetical protein
MQYIANWIAYREDCMSNAQEKRVTRVAQTKGFTLEKVGKGPHHGRFAIVNVQQGSRMPSGVTGAEYSFSIAEAEDWLTKAAK